MSRVEKKGTSPGTDHLRLAPAGSGSVPQDPPAGLARLSHLQMFLFSKFQNRLAGYRLTAIERFCAAGESESRPVLSDGGWQDRGPPSAAVSASQRGRRVMDTAQESWKRPSASNGRSPSRQVGCEQTLTNAEWTQCPRRLAQQQGTSDRLLRCLT